MTTTNVADLEIEWAAAVDAYDAASARVDRLADELGAGLLATGSYGIEDEGFAYGVLASGDPVETVDHLDDNLRATLAGRAYGRTIEVDSHR